MSENIIEITSKNRYYRNNNIIACLYFYLSIGYEKNLVKIKLISS